MKIGYARVSRDDQDNGRQVAALKAAGCELIYQEKESGANNERPELLKMLEGLEAGSVVMVLKLDRLGRDLRYLLDISRMITERGAAFKSLTEPFDTSTVMGKMMFQLMGTFAEWERDTIRERVRHGLAHRKAQGVHIGRPLLNRSEVKRQIEALERQGQTRDEVRQALGLTMGRYYKAKKWQQATTA